LIFVALPAEVQARAVFDAVFDIMAQNPAAGPLFNDAMSLQDTGDQN
jgi:hypothetical protein